MPDTPSMTRELWRTTKPGITVSNTLMAIAGCASAWPESNTTDALVTATLASTGTALAVAAANTFNMVLEHERDAQMERTRLRPIAAGRLTPKNAWTFASLLSMGAALTLAQTTLAATLIGLFAIAAYAFVYTPLKARTPHALFIGALPGATPPLIGALAMGEDGLPIGLALFALIVFWQVPHFLAIATRRVDDYRRAGLRPFPVTHGDALTRALSRSCALALVPASALPWLAGAMSPVAALCLATLGIYLAAVSLRSRWVSPTFIASLVYLPALTAVVLVDRLAARALH
jgi:protoheme IX farnesyltransferase